MNPAGHEKLLILDCDGVLVRSERANVAYYNHLFETFGLPQVGEGERAAIGLLHTLSTPQVIECFVPAGLREQAHAYSQQLEYARFLPLLEPEPGWDEVLAWWRARGGVAVATNRGRSARAVLAAVGLLEYTDHVVTVQDVSRPKPHPDLLLKAVEHFGVELADAFYVGDSSLDAEAAERAGIQFLGFRRAKPPTASSPQEVAGRLAAFARNGGSGTLRSRNGENPR